MDLQRLKSDFDSALPAPLHAKLYKALAAQIADDTLSPGQLLPSERHLQTLLNLSRPTIRQAINGLIQEGKVKRVPGKGTFVLEPVVTKTPTGLIGLIVSRPDFHFFYPQLAAAFHEQVRAQNYGMVIALHGDRADLLAEVIEGLLLSQHIVGLAITPPRFGDATPIEYRLRQAGVPFIFIGRHIKNNDVDSIAPDNHQIGYQATKHLLNLGHSRIVHLGLSDYSTGLARLNGYQRAMIEAKLPPQFVEISEQVEIMGTNSNDEDASARLAVPARKAALHLLAQTPRPTAVFCFNDLVAMGVYKAARELGLQIPQDLSLISVDNLPTVTHFEVPLTTFALPGAEIGKQGADLLLKRLAGTKTSPQQYALPAPMIQRSSTAIQPS